jgi:LAGLIDADG DNA endonuclease family
LFKSYCPSEPKTFTRSPDKRTGKEYSKIKFSTYSLPCFNELLDLFYPEGKKVVPKNIADLLTLEGLCFWICDDGYWYGNGVHLCTNAFTKEEVNLLVKALYDNYNLKCSICLGGSSVGFVIRISSKSVSHLQALLSPIMPPMMRHKILGKS